MTVLLRRVLLLFAMCAVMVGGSAHIAAQRAAPAEPTDKAIQNARELVLAMGAEKQLETVIPALIGQLTNMLKMQQPRHAREIDEVFKLLGKRFLERKGEILELVAPFYAKRFTEAELGEMVAFFRTPVGRKMAAELPGLSQEAMEAGITWGRRLGMEMDAEVRRELKSRGVDL